MSKLIFVLAILAVISTYGCADKDIMKDSFFHGICACTSIVSIVAFVIVLAIAIL